MWRSPENVHFSIPESFLSCGSEQNPVGKSIWPDVLLGPAKYFGLENDSGIHFLIDFYRLIFENKKVLSLVLFRPRPWRSAHLGGVRRKQMCRKLLRTISGRFGGYEFAPRWTASRLWRGIAPITQMRLDFWVDVIFGATREELNLLVLIRLEFEHLFRHSPL